MRKPNAYHRAIIGVAGRTGIAGLNATTYRASDYKGQSQFKLFRKVSRNYIDDVEIDVQTRDFVGWGFSHTHKHYIGAWTTTLGGSLRGSLPSWSKNTGILVGEPDWDGRYHLGVFDLTATRQDKWQDMTWRYQTQLHWQSGGKQLPASEYASIGGRYSVRGFDGGMTLSSESGGYWRNDFGVAFNDDHEIYAALDGGRISGPQSKDLQQKTLAGTALGLRGRFWIISYDVSLGWPLEKPDSFASDPAVAATISIEFGQ